MSTADDPQPIKALPKLSWPIAVSLTTAAVAAATVALHLIGYVTHTHYLRFWGVDSGLFPKSTDWLLINGYYAAVDRFVVMLNAMATNLLWMLALAIALGAYSWVLTSPIFSRQDQAPAWLRRQPEGRRRFVRYLLNSGLFVSTLPLALLLLIAFMVIPALFGESSGKATAEKEAAEFRKGCQQLKRPCIELRKDGQAVATGFVLDSSSAHIAIFDVQMQRSRVLERSQLELVSRGMLPP